MTFLGRVVHERPSREGKTHTAPKKITPGAPAQDPWARLIGPVAAGPLGVRAAALWRAVLRLNRAHLWFGDALLASAMLVIALIWAHQYREVGGYAFDPRLARHFHRLDGLSILLIAVMSFATAVRWRAPTTQTPTTGS